MISVKVWVAFGKTPLLAENVSWWTPDFFGVPLNTPLVRLKLTPDGSEPETFRVGLGGPVALTVNDPKTPRWNVIESSLVK